MLQLETLLGGSIERQIRRHKNELQKVLNLIERSPRLELLDRSPTGDRMLINVEARTLRTVPGQAEPVMRDFTPLELFAPVIGLDQFTYCRVATEQLPPGELPFSCHILPNAQGLVCTGSHWTRATFSLDLVLLTVHDVLRGHNYLASPRDTLNPLAVPYYQRLRAEGKLPHDERALI